MDVVETVTAVFLGVLAIVQVALLAILILGSPRRRRRQDRRRRPDIDPRDSMTKG